jgi:hypothetical protein
LKLLADFTFDRAVAQAQPEPSGIFMNTNLYTRFSAAPLELRAYALFSVIVTVLGYALAIYGPKNLWEAVIPFTGWSVNAGYAFGLFFTVALIYTKKSPLWPLRLGIIAPLALQIIFGLQAMTKPSANDFGNPYLTVSPWQPVWTVVIPALWIAILLSPRMRRFGKVPEKSQTA